MTRLTRYWLLLVLILAVITLVVLALRDPEFSDRHLAFVPREDPRELVAGAPGLRQPRASPVAERISVSALESAAEYAAAHDSKALIVGRHGHLVFERYWEGSDAEAVEDGGTFARTLAVLMVGVALEDREIASVNDPASLYLGESTDGERSSARIRDLLEAEDAQPLVSLIERATDRRYADYVSRGLWKPLAASNAWVELEDPGGAAKANCCFFARQADWMRIGHLLANDGLYQGSRLLPQGWVARMLTPSQRGPQIGLHVRLDSPRDGFHLKGKEGNRLWIVPGLGLVILRFGSDRGGWDDGRIPELIIAGIEDRPTPAKPGEVDVSDLVPNH